MISMRASVLTVGLLALVACSPKTTAPPAPVDTAADEAVLRAGTKGWLDAYNAGNVDTILALYASDAVVMPPNAPAVSTPDALRAFLTTDMAGSKAAGIQLVDGQSTVGFSGDLGWHSGSYTVQSASGETVGGGSYMEIWQKKDGKWQIIRDIWNSDRPVEPAPAASPATKS